MGYYLNQLKALIKRNIAIKKASKNQTFMEILFPIIMIFAAVMFNKMSETEIYEATDPLEPIDLLSGIGSIYPENAVIGFILPENNPDENIINKIMENNLISGIKSIHFKDEKEMTEYNNDFQNFLLAGVLFESDDYLHYTIRVNNTSVPSPTADAITNYAIGRNMVENALVPYMATQADNYLNIFTPIQMAIDQAIISNRINDTVLLHSEFGKLGRAESQYSSSSGGGYSGAYLSMIFMYPLSIIVVSLVQEKEKGIRDGLLMAGTHPTVFWLSWLIVYSVYSLIFSLITVIAYKLANTLSNCNIIIFFLAIFLFGISCNSLGFAFSAPFKKTKTVGSVVSILFIILIYVNMFTENISLPVRKVLSIFLSPLSLGSFIYEVNYLNNTFKTLNFSNLFTTSAGFFFIVLIINNVLYFIMAIVLDNYFSNENSRYLLKSKKKINDLHEEGEVTYQKDIQEDFNAQNGENCIVEVSRVHKVFQKKKGDDDDNSDKQTNKSKKGHGKEFLAVDDVSFKVYENEIFAILGHNGAGKTTLINIMVGLLKASCGDVYFDGRSIEKDINAIRKDFGVCAQTNIIYDELTVEDHINFYSNLKGVKVDVDEVLRELDLLSQKNVKAAKLSGGQKRKLCIGMAIIGNPRYIFLDEPTTGLDPLSRRKIWDLLSKRKNGRVIFLTTHYMDEADILADRKLILTKGKIRCLGTSLYLKNHFNMNYDLNVETEHRQELDTLIQNFVPEATYLYEPERTVSQEGEENKDTLANVHTWRLPVNATNKFSKLMDALESKVDQGVIQKFGLSMPTLEELFIRLEDNTIGEEDMDDNRSVEEQFLIQTGENQLPQLKPVQKLSRMGQLINLIKYRLKIFLKDKTFAFNNVLLPVITTGIMFILINKMLTKSSESSESSVLSMPSTYSGSYINLDPESTLGISPENIITAVENQASLVKNIPLASVPNPQVNEPYYVSSVTGEGDAHQYQFKVYYNDTMTHALPATMNTLSNAILASKNSKDQIVVTSHPFDTNSNMLAILGLSLAGLMIGFSVVSIISKFGPLVVRERVNQLLQQLQLNGVSRLNYWASCFISDNIIFIVTCVLIFAVGLIVQFKPLMDVKVFIIVIILLLIWSFPTMIYQYVLSFLFKKEESAYSILSIINTYSVIFGYIIFTMINLNSSTDLFEGRSTGVVSKAGIFFNAILTFFFPTYGFLSMTNALFTMKMYNELFNYDFGLANIFSFKNGITPILLVLVVLFVILFFTLIYLDARKNQTKSNDIHELPETTRSLYEEVLNHGDDDVKAEFEYVKAHQPELPISVLHLSKEYKAKTPTNKELKQQILSRDPNHFQFGDIHRSLYDTRLVKTAVIDVSFGVRNHECFGLLGPNGAGKSTTLNTVTSTIPQTTGKICFNGIETHKARLGEISMGYCPQVDILWKELTLREHLEFFLTIRGYSRSEAKEYATQYINCVGLEEHQHKRVEKLSGGTKRKLSLLIAICGYPKQILLDEPTAGMDPSTRRLIWNIIKKTKSMNDSALIMTTHSMEEAENLCDRIAILVNGRLSCIGSPEHLKMKFGEGYLLEVQSKEVERFHREIVEQGQIFGKGTEYTRETTSSDRSKYTVKITRHLGHVFEVMEECKARGLVSDYSFNQTSLEQVFINFARDQILDTNE